MYNILLFLYANNFLNMANYILLMFVLVRLFDSKMKIKLLKSNTFLLLVLGSFTYCLLYLDNYDFIDKSSFSLRFIAPVILFYWGFIIGVDGVDRIKKSIVLIAFAGCMHGFMNVFENRNVDILSIAGRQYQDIYGGVISGTLQNLFFVVSSALLFYFVVCAGDRKYRIVGIIMGLSGSIASVINASRTMIAVTIIVFVFSLFLYLYLNHNFETSIIYFLSISIVMFVGIAFIWWMNIFNVQELLYNSALGRREAMAVASSSIVQNIRWTYAVDILKVLPSYPLGGIPYYYYAHNLWVDIARESGIIPFVLYVLFTIASVVETVQFYRNSYKVEDIVFIVPIVISFIVVFFTEPIMDGAPLSFSLFAFIIGAIVSLNKKPMKY